MIKLLLFATLLLSSPAVGAQNHLVNSGFDTDLAGWEVSGAVLPAWADFDVAANPKSGSALIKNVEADAFSDVQVLNQCIVTGAGGYVWGAWFYIPSGQTETGTVLIRYGYHANTSDCSGGFSGLGGHEIAGPLDQWLHLVGNQINASPGAAGSLRFSIAIRKTQANGEFKAYVDDTRLYKEVLLSNSFE